MIPICRFILVILAALLFYSGNGEIAYVTKYPLISSLTTIFCGSFGVFMALNMNTGIISDSVAHIRTRQLLSRDSD